MDIQEITTEEALKGLQTTATEDRYIENTTLPQELAKLLFAAYRKGVDEYQTRFWEAEDKLDAEKERRQQAENKFTALAVKIAEDAIASTTQN